MPAGAYYNEFDPGAAAWLTELIAEGHLPAGDVDRRSIKDVRGDDLRGYSQCHFFAGIGIWPAALRHAGWPERRPVGSASCPCQGFSLAGKGLGFDDPRHLWPEFRRVRDEAAEQGQPWTATLIGEQVAAAGAWVDLVQSDLEDRSYAFAATDIPAAGFAQGAHIRQRFYWVADRDDAERWADLAGRDFSDWPQAGRVEGDGEPGTGGATGGLGYTCDPGSPADTRDDGEVLGLPPGQRPDQRSAVSGGPGAAGGLGHHHQDGRIRLEERDQFTAIRLPASRRNDVDRPGALRGLEQADWLYCSDERWRPVEAGTFPLAASHPGRLGLLRGYGNALDFETAVGFVSAFLEAEMLS